MGLSSIGNLGAFASNRRCFPRKKSSRLGFRIASRKGRFLSRLQFRDVSALASSALILEASFKTFLKHSNGLISSAAQQAWSGVIPLMAGVRTACDCGLTWLSIVWGQIYTLCTFLEFDAALCLEYYDAIVQSVMAKGSTSMRIRIGIFVIGLVAVLIFMLNGEDECELDSEIVVVDVEGKVPGVIRGNESAAKTPSNRFGEEPEASLLSNSNTSSESKRTKELIVDLSSIEFSRDRLMVGSLNNQLLEDLLLYVKRHGVSTEDLVAHLATVDFIPPAVVIALAFTSGFENGHAEFLGKLVDKALSATRSMDGSGFEQFNLGVAASHVLRLRGVSPDFSDRIQQVMTRLERQPPGVNGYNCLAALILQSGTSVDHQVREEIAKKILSYDPTWDSAHVAFAVLLEETPNFISEAWAQLQDKSVSGALLGSFASVSDPQARPLLKDIIRQGRDVPYPARMSAMLGLAAMNEPESLKEFVSVIEHGQGRVGPYPDDQELLKRSFKKHAAWYHIPGIVSSLEGIERGSKSEELVSRLVSEFLDENSRLGYSKKETARARKAMRAVLQGQMKEGNIAKLCFRTLGRIGTMSDIDFLERTGRRLDMGPHAETAREMIERLDF